MLLPVAFQHEAAGDYEGAAAHRGCGVELGSASPTPDDHGPPRGAGDAVRDGRVREELSLLDRPWLPPPPRECPRYRAGIVYCGDQSLAL